MANLSGVIYSGISVLSNKLLISNYIDIFKISFVGENIDGMSDTSQYKHDITYTSYVSNNPLQIRLNDVSFDKIISKNKNLIVDNNSIFLIQILRLKQELGIPFFLKTTQFMGLAILKYFNFNIDEAILKMELTFEELPLILPTAIDVNGGAVVSKATLKKVV